MGDFGRCAGYLHHYLKPHKAALFPAIVLQRQGRSTTRDQTLAYAVLTGLRMASGLWSPGDCIAEIKEAKTSGWGVVQIPGDLCLILPTIVAVVN